MTLFVIVSAAFQSPPSPLVCHHWLFSIHIFMTNLSTFCSFSLPHTDKTKTRTERYSNSSSSNCCFHQKDCWLKLKLPNKLCALLSSSPPPPTWQSQITSYSKSVWTYAWCLPLNSSSFDLFVSHSTTHTHTRHKTAPDWREKKNSKSRQSSLIVSQGGTTSFV